MQPDSTRLLSRERVGVITGAVALTSMLAFEALAVAVAMPAVATALDGLGGYALAFGGPMAFSVLGMVMAGQSADRHGPLRATVLGLTLFTAGLLLAGLAPSMGWLQLGRFLQGLGGGMLAVTLYVGTGQLVPAALHPRLFSLFAAAWVLPGLVGPSLAAVLVQHVGWRSVFLIVAVAAPLTAFVLLPAFARLPVLACPGRSARAERVKLLWAAVATGGALLLHGAVQTAGHGPGPVSGHLTGPQSGQVSSQASAQSSAQASAHLSAHMAVGAPVQGAGPSSAWGLRAAPVGVDMLGVGLSLLGGLLALLAARRLLPAGTLRAAPGLPAVIALRALMAASFATAEVFLPLFLTRDAGWSLAQAGMALSVGAVFWSIGSALQTRLVVPQRRRQGLIVGFCLQGLGMVLVTLVLWLGWPGALLVAGWALAGFGVGLGFPMLSVLTLALSAPGASGQNSSALQLCDALTCSAALALAGGLFAAGGSFGPTLVLGLAVALAALGALLGHRAFAVSA